jgi:surfactin synthase thioesterase subunit
MNSHSSPHIVFFHHAGGSGAAMSEFARRFNTDFNVVVMEMPGRGRRRMERLKDNAKQVINDFVEKIPETNCLVLVGHSLGAYMAYLTAGYYKKNMPDMTVCLVLLSNEPIHCRQNFSWIKDNEMPTLALMEFAECAGQLPEWLKQNETLKHQFLAVLAADLKIADSIVPEQTQPLNDVPVLVIYGEEDPILHVPQERWQECTTGPFFLTSVPGGHFIIQTEENTIYETINHFVNQLNILT